MIESQIHVFSFQIEKREVKIGQKKCPKMKTPERLLKKAWIYSIF
jgi:hypothetical protein